jgi:2-dehydropantoate 2-reductase
MEKLALEAVAVANSSGLDFCYDDVIEDIKLVIENSKHAYTSIYFDLKNGRKTEVDTISGSVVDSAKALGIEVPNHVFVVQAIHAMESLHKRRAN